MHRQPSTPPPLPITSLTPWNKSLHAVRVPTETSHVHRQHPPPPPPHPPHHSPLGIRVSTQSEYPLRQAMCTGSIPPAPLRIRLATLQARVLVTEAWPCRAAMCRAVFFCLSTRAPGGRWGRHCRLQEFLHRKEEEGNQIWERGGAEESPRYTQGMHCGRKAKVDRVICVKMIHVHVLS